ncbi:MAG TPA: acyltransferase family protein [Nocardioidaceae bacterium]|nr:acyltransferase family protein [Nocardioidaceae bacterium]
MAARRHHRVRLAMPAMRSRGDIQGLRAIAVLLVVLAHAGVPGFAGGYVGVDVFFVVSGFLITSILLHEATEHGSISLTGFYSKRARRILPAATVALMATATAAIALLPYIRAQQTLGDVAWSAFFAANVRFGHEQTDYFSRGQAPSPVQHFWSLAVEEQFYLVWPALIILVLVGAGHRASVVRRRLRWLGLLAAGLAAASFAWSIATTPTDPTGAYFATTTRGWELGAGALLAFAGRSLHMLSGAMRTVLAVLGLASIAIAAVTFTDHTPVPGYAMALPVAGTVAVLAAGSGIPDRSGPILVRLLGRQPLRWIGDVSYGFYLWHWPFLILASAYLGHRLSVPANLALAGGALLVAWLSYRLIENPIRRAPTLSLRPRLALLLWPAAIGSLLIVNFGSQAYIDHERRVLAAAAADVDLSELPPSQRMPRNGDRIHDALADAIDRATLDAPQTPVDDLKAVSEEFVRDPACRASEEQSSHVICPIGAVGSDRRMVVLGDSHAQMWLPALDLIAQRTGYELVPITKLGCTPYAVVAWKFDRDEVYTECNDFHPWALDQVRLADPDVIIVGSASVIRSVDPTTGDLLSPDIARQTWRNGARSLAEELLTIAPDVLFMEDINRLPWNPADCLSNLRKTAADCTFSPSEWVADSNRLVRHGIAGTGAWQLKTHDWFCLRDRCPTVVAGRSVYGDDDHMASGYAVYLVDALEKRLRLPMPATPNL